MFGTVFGILGLIEFNLYKVIVYTIFGVAKTFCENR